MNTINYKLARAAGGRSHFEKVSFEVSSTILNDTYSEPENDPWAIFALQGASEAIALLRLEEKIPSLRLINVVGTDADTTNSSAWCAGVLAICNSPFVSVSFNTKYNLANDQWRIEFSDGRALWSPT